MDTGAYLTKAAEKCGFTRERYNDAEVPTNADAITVIVFFGDLRSLFVLSSILLKRLCEEERGSRYTILCSWPGFEGLFPYVGEYWGISDEAFGKMYPQASQFRNKSEQAKDYYRKLHTLFFDDLVLPYEHFQDVYGTGITNEFWKRYKQVRRTLAGVPSAAVLGNDFHKQVATRAGYKVFVMPTKHAQVWRLGETHQVPVSKDFWVYLLGRLVAEKFCPVVYWGPLAHDLSPELAPKCVYMNRGNFGEVLAAMRSAGCVLDVFNGSSRLALAARCPFVAVDERHRHAVLKEYEIDDLCGPQVPKQYIFSFPTIIENGTPESWEWNIVSGVIERLTAFIPGLDRDSWPPTGESTEVVSYDTVRRKKAKRFGTRLLKVPTV